MIVNNYTSIKRREKRIYSIFNQTVSRSGFTANTLIVCGVLLGLFTVIGVIFCFITGTLWYNPANLIENSDTGYFYIIFIGFPIGIGVCLNTVKIQNYKLIEYLSIYFTPKIPRDENGKRISISRYKIDKFIERM